MSATDADPTTTTVVSGLEARFVGQVPAPEDLQRSCRRRRGAVVLITGLGGAQILVRVLVHAFLARLVRLLLAVRRRVTLAG